jgi:IS30 family transposase
MINRHISSAFWTRERDKTLQNLETAGVSPEKIAVRLGVTPSAVYRRSYYLRRRVPPPYRRGEELRARAAQVREEKGRRDTAALSAMHKSISRGVPRNEAIMAAGKAGAGPQAIANEFGLSRVSVYRILVLQGESEKALSAKAAKRRKEKNDREKAAIASLRRAIARGIPRDRAITDARRAGARYAAIGKIFGLTRQRVHQISLLQSS